MPRGGYLSVLVIIFLLLAVIGTAETGCDFGFKYSESMSQNQYSSTREGVGEPHSLQQETQHSSFFSSFSAWPRERRHNRAAVRTPSNTN